MADSFEFPDIFKLLQRQVRHHNRLWHIALDRRIRESARVRGVSVTELCNEGQIDTVSTENMPGTLQRWWTFRYRGEPLWAIKQGIDGTIEDADLPGRTS